MLVKGWSYLNYTLIAVSFAISKRERDEHGNSAALWKGTSSWPDMTSGGEERGELNYTALLFISLLTFALSFFLFLVSFPEWWWWWLECWCQRERKEDWELKVDAPLTLSPFPFTNVTWTCRVQSVSWGHFLWFLWPIVSACIRASSWSLFFEIAIAWTCTASLM